MGETIPARGAGQEPISARGRETFALESGKTYLLPVPQFIAVEYKIITKSLCKQFAFFVRGLLDEGLPTSHQMEW